MTYPAAARALVDRRIRHVGAGLAITLRRRSTLRHRVTQAAISSLALATAAAGGATSIDLFAASMQGDLVVGSQIQIAAATYTTTTTNTAGDDGKLSAVGITPALAGAASVGAAALVTRSYAEQGYAAMKVEAVDEGLGGWVEGASKSYRLSAALGERPPLKGDLVYDGAAGLETVKRVTSIDPAGRGALGWQIWVGVGT